MKQMKQSKKNEQLSTINQNNQQEQDKNIQKISMVNRSKKIKPVTKKKNVQRQIKRKIQNLSRTACKLYIAALTALYSIALSSNPVSAGDFGTSIFATGTKDLVTDVGKYLLIIAPISGGLLGVYFFIRRQAADEMDQKKWNDRIKVAVISTLGAVLVSAAIVLIASYYGKTVSTGL